MRGPQHRLYDYGTAARPAINVQRDRHVSACEPLSHDPGADHGREQERVELELEEGPLEARGDPALLKQVLVNLVINALEATRERGKGRLVLGCHRKSETRMELSVEDDGPGIPEEIGDRMFAPFVTSKEAGTGLGLTIVKRIVDRHGGAIHVASAPGQGTRIWVTLPGTG